MPRQIPKKATAGNAQLYDNGYGYQSMIAVKLSGLQGMAPPWKIKTTLITW